MHLNDAVIAMYCNWFYYRNTLNDFTTRSACKLFYYRNTLEMISFLECNFNDFTTEISSSLCRAASTDFPDSPLPFVFLIYHFR